MNDLAETWEDQRGTIFIIKKDGSGSFDDTVNGNGIYTVKFTLADNNRALIMYAPVSKLSFYFKIDSFSSITNEMVLSATISGVYVVSFFKK